VNETAMPKQRRCAHQNNCFIDKLFYLQTSDLEGEAHEMSILNLRKFLMSASVLVGASTLAFTPQAFAQEEDEDTEEAEIEEIITTGSRIVRDTFSSISPLQVIDGETSRDLGLVDTSELLRQTTVVQGQQITTGLSTSAGLLTANGPGSSTASLRGLDAGRTLVMVNGRRLAPAGVGGAPSNPDLNMVPGTLIERVDVLLDGASSVYGSDAVAGVVNVIMRSDFDGLEFDAFQS
jgi:iron complex outermembrane receptor protein